MTKTSVVIPAYNEGKRIEKTIQNSLDYLQKRSEPFEIIISDDGSDDETCTKVERFIKEFPNLIKLVRNQHSGKATAVKSGVERADGDFTLMMDADGAVDISELSKLGTKLEMEKADVAIGSREGREAQRIGEPFYRHFLGRVFNRLVKTITGLKFEDTQCGFKLFKTEVIKDLAQKSQIMNQKKEKLNGPLVTAFDVELLLLAQKRGHRVVEVPIVWRHIPTQNVRPIKDSLRMLSDIIKIRLRLNTA